MAVAVYAIAITLGFAISAAYHIYDWAPPIRVVMQRLDHSTIFVVIAGSYAPICMHAVPSRVGHLLLTTIAVGALIGILIKVWFFDRAVRLGWALYLVVGWTAVVALPMMATTVGLITTVLVVSGGLLYTAGVPIILFRRPDPWPAVFGYHEVWHGLTVVAACLHFAAVCRLVA